MDWLSIGVGAGIGIVGELIVRDMFYPAGVQQVRHWRVRRRIRRINKAWDSIRGLIPTLEVVQAGWLSGGTFDSRQVRLWLGNSFQLPNEIENQIRAKHESRWDNDGFTDGEQVGIMKLQIRRLSDDPKDEREGRSQVVEIEAQTYRYFDFLATHRLLAAGTAQEKELLSRYAGPATPEEPIKGFPNPLSVGLSLLCEGGDVLVLLGRTNKTASGGSWHGGKVFNPVGENAARVDFHPTLSGVLESSPMTVARRGLYQEMGFAQSEAETIPIAMHTLAYANDIRDHKFFGHSVSALSRSEIRLRWENAPDKHENREIHFHRVGSRTEAKEFWTETMRDKTSWSPEALLCTMRSLLFLGKLKPDDLVNSSTNNRAA